MNDADSKPNTTAIIFAGGTGSRMGHKDGPKQFMAASGKPLIVYTLDLFQSHAEIDAIYISTVRSQIAYVEKLVKTHGLSKVRKVIPGGDTAQASIMCALDAAASDGQPEDTVALIHDGVRPVVPMTLISKNIRDTLATGSSITCIPAYETVCRSRDGMGGDEVLDRDDLYILQAPQCFRLGHVRRIIQRAVDEGRVGSFVDMANMMNHYDETVSLTPGIRGNIKITVQHDFDYFDYLVRTGRYAHLVGASS